MENRELWLRRFEESLTRLFGREGFPRPLVGDLDDLLCTIEQAEDLLRFLASSGPVSDIDELRAKFVRLGVLLDQDLPMILEDLSPAMKALLPDQHEESSGER